MKEWTPPTTIKIEQFKKANASFIENPLIQRFLENRHHYELLKQSLEHPTVKNREKVDTAFKQHYVSARFISYISTSLNYHACNYNKQLTSYEKRYSLLLDAEIEEASNETRKDRLIDDRADINRMIEELGNEEIREYIEDSRLYEAIQLLSPAQRKVLSYAYIERLKDTEISKEMNTSQQYISRTHQVALEKISKFLEEKKEGDFK